MICYDSLVAELETFLIGGLKKIDLLVIEEDFVKRKIFIT
jgi:hypothetical protein